MNFLGVQTDADLGAYPGGTEIYSATLTGGVWVEYKYRRPLFDLILADITG